MLKLYYGPGACSFVPHVGLEAIKAATGEPFEAQAVKLHKGEQLTPEYLAINPLGLVPVLMVEGKPLNQILAICTYLDARYPQAGLLPADPWQRAEAMSTFAWMNNTVHTTFTHIFKPQKFAESEAAQSDVRHMAASTFRGALGRIDGMAAKAAPFLLGDKLSFIDAYALTFLRWAGLVGIDPAAYPAYQAYVDRVTVEPTVAAAIAREGIAVKTYVKK